MVYGYVFVRYLTYDDNENVLILRSQYGMTKSLTMVIME